jgi:hypothetical protein
MHTTKQVNKLKSSPIENIVSQKVTKNELTSSSSALSVSQIVIVSHPPLHDTKPVNKLKSSLIENTVSQKVINVIKKEPTSSSSPLSVSQNVTVMESSPIPTTVSPMIRAIIGKLKVEDHEITSKKMINGSCNKTNKKWQELANSVEGGLILRNVIDRGLRSSTRSPRRPRPTTPSSPSTMTPSTSSSQSARTPGKSRPARSRLTEGEQTLKMTSPLRGIKTASSMIRNKAGSMKPKKTPYKNQQRCKDTPCPGVTGASLAGQFVDTNGQLQSGTNFSTLLNQWEHSSSRNSSIFDSSSRSTRGPDRETFVDSQ